MKVNDDILIRFINNDLSKSKKKQIQLLINNNPKIKSKFEGLKNFKFLLMEESKANRKTKMPNDLFQKISDEREKKIKYSRIKFSNFYKIAAGIMVFISISWLIAIPNKTYLSKNPFVEPDNSNRIHIFYDNQTLNEFLSKNSNNCSLPEEIIDENKKEVFAVSCKID